MPRKTLISLCLFIFSGSIPAQTPKASWPELGWAIVHPIAAIRVKLITKKCNTLIHGQLTTLSNSPMPDSLYYPLRDKYPNGGKQDAFRHIFFMAAYSQTIKVKKLRKLGIAHEKANYRYFIKGHLEDGELPDSLGAVMDLHNNELGLKLGKQHKKIQLSELMPMVSKEIKCGEALIMKRDASGNYLDCEGRKIDLVSMGKKWKLPKCLVRSDFVY